MELAYFQVNTRLDSESVLFVGVSGLFKVKTPFIVRCVSPTTVHNIGQQIKVYKVNHNGKDELLYLIGADYYSHHNFQYKTEDNK